MTGKNNRDMVFKRTGVVLLCFLLLGVPGLAQVVDFSTPSQNGPESSGTFTVTVQLDAPFGSDIDVSYSVAGTATEGAAPDDFTIATSPLTIPMNTTSADLTINIFDDADTESNETVEITLTGTTAGSLGSILVHTATIEDNDTPPVVNITAPANNHTVVEGTNINFTGTATDAEEGPLTSNINWNSDQDGDFGTGGSVNFSGLSVNTHTITASVTDGSGLSGSAQITVVVGSQEVSFTSASQSDAEDTGTLTATVQLSQPAGSDVSIPFTVGGTATQGGANDFTVTASPVTITTGQSSVDITITVNDDSETESNETVILTLGTPSVGSLGSPNVHTATIEDNDTPPVVNITAPADNHTVIEGTNINFTGTATDAEEGPLTANINWNSDQDGDFGTGGSVNFSGLSVNTHTITASVTDGSGLSGSAQITVVVGSLVVDFASASQSNDEGVGTMTATVQLSQPAGSDVSIPFTVGGTATQGGANDFTVTASPVTITTGQSSVDITITVNDDSETESNETVILTLGTPSVGSLGSSNVHTATIEDNDTPPVVTITAPLDGATEAMGTNITFTATAIDNDGDLSGNLFWESDLDGDIGNGATFMYGGLSPGMHIITARVFDSDGLEGTDAIIINITNTAPNVTITDPPDGLMVQEGANIMFAATAIDSEEGDLSPGLTWIASLDGGIGSGPSVNTAALSVGTQTVTASVTDGGGLVGNDAVTVTVTAPMAAPTGDNNTVTTEEDITYIFTEADFTVNYSDPDGDPFAEIRITSLETAGSLELNSTAVTLNQVITAAQLNGNELTFVPVPDASGTPYASFDFEVGDGSEFSVSSYTMTIDVNAVNDPPTGGSNTVTTDEDVTYTFSSADFMVGYNDPDGDPFARIRVTSLETAGSLELNSTAVTLNQVITAAQLGNLTFDPVADQSGAPYATFGFEVGDATSFSASAYTMTIDVNAVNDPPTGGSNTVTTDEDVTYTFSSADFMVGYNDPDGDPFARIRVTSLETAGSLELNSTAVTLNQVITAAQLGNLTFDPVADQSGAPYATFGFEVGDATSFSASAYTMTIDVNAVNDPPTGGSNTVTTDEDVTYTFSSADFMVGYNDPDGDPFARIRVTSLETAGSLELNSTAVTLNQVITAAQLGNLTFDPVADQSGAPYATFGFEVGDATSFSASAYTMTIDVNAVNDPPTGGSNTVTTDEDVTYTFSSADFMVGYNDPDGDPFARIRVTSLETAGSLELNSTAVTLNQVITAAQLGNLTFDPVADQSGAPYATFGFEVGDATSFSASAYTMTIDVNAVNDPPTGGSNTVTTDEDVTYTFSSADFMVGYNDPDGDPFARIRVTSLETAGSLELNSTAVTLNQVITAAQLGNLTFDPVADQSGAPYATFGFEVGDATSFSASAYTMTIDVNAVNDPPIGGSNTVTTNEDVTHTFSAANFTIGYNDPDGDPFAEIRVTSLETVGNLLFGGNPVTLNQVITNAQLGANQLTFVPLAGQSGSPYDTFDFEVGDGSAFSTTDYTLTIDVISTNDPPTDIFLTNAIIAENQPIPTMIGDLSSEDPDVGDTHTYTLVAGSGSTHNASFSIVGNQLQTAAVLNFESGSTLNIRIQTADAAGAMFSKAFNITVTDLNDLPLAIDDLNNSTIESTSVVIDVAGNDTDEDGTVVPNSVAIVANPTNGTAVNNGDGTITYTPNSGFTGGDNFTYTIEDNLGATSLPGSVVVTVGPNSPPVANDDLSNTTNEDTPIVINVIANDTDSDGSIDPSTINITNDPILGTVVANNDGTTTYTPNQDANGTDEFAYTVDDNLGATSNQARVRVTINPLNDPPTANDDVGTTPEDTPVIISVLLNDVDVDGTTDPTTVSIVATPSNGTAVVNLDGTITYTPSTGYNGVDTFTYNVRDDLNALSNVATVTVTIISVNNRPDAVDDTNNSTVEETVITINVIANDIDVDGTIAPGSVTIISDVISGTTLNNGDGTVTYTPNVDFNGTDSFTYTVQDDLGAVSDTAIVSILVTEFNDPPVAVDDLNNTTNEDESIIINLTSNDIDCRRLIRSSQY